MSVGVGIERSAPGGRAANPDLGAATEPGAGSARARHTR